MGTWPSVSIAFPCWNRGTLLSTTLVSIQRQRYPGPLELVIVETGSDDDGYTKQLSAEYNTRYVNIPRLEEFPVFQSVTEMWNRCLRECSNDIVMLQCAEIQHESAHVIQDLVERVQSGNKILATPLIREIAQNGTMAGWYNHPRLGTRPGWVSGAGPHAFRRTEMLEVGGYEEMFYGYGHEDDYFFLMLRKLGWSIEYVESAVTGHQWHERFPYEPVTGFANRALIRTLEMEIEDGVRQLSMNTQPLKIDISTTEQTITDAVMLALGQFKMTETFKNWGMGWIAGERQPDRIFEAQRFVANEQHPFMRAAEMIMESAWAVVRAQEAYAVSAAATGNWKERSFQRAQITHTWAARSLARAYKLMGVTK
jgi:hypothetical protein